MLKKCMLFSVISLFLSMSHPVLGAAPLSEEDQMIQKNGSIFDNTSHKKPLQFSIDTSPQKSESAPIDTGPQKLTPQGESSAPVEAEAPTLSLEAKKKALWDAALNMISALYPVASIDPEQQILLTDWIQRGKDKEEKLRIFISDSPILQVFVFERCKKKNASLCSDTSAQKRAQELSHAIYHAANISE